MYLMTCTRPDLAYPLSLLARYVALGRHRKVHWDAAKRVLRYLCSTSGMGLVLGVRARVVLTCHADASWVDDLATQRSSQGYTFSLGSNSVSWESIRSSSIISSSCEAEIYAGAMAAQELRWLTYLLSELGEAPCSPPVLYVDNKAMLALCQEHRLEHRTKHIALRYFLTRELQQRGQLRLAYMASQANTADVFTKALQPCDLQRGSRATQKRRATDSPATEGAAANLSPSQVAALLALVQKQATASITTPAATIEAEIFASAKTANIRNHVSTSARVAASLRADKGKAPAVEDEPAAPDDSDSNFDSDAGEEPNNPMPLLPNDLLPPLPSPHPSTAAAAFNRKGVRDQAEVFQALQTYLAHMEHKIRGGDAAGALKTVGQAQDLIKRRFDVLVIADHAGFDVAERYQLLKTTAVLTSRSFKMAVADMAALKRMKTGFARGSRPFHSDSPHFMPKTMGSGNGCRGFKGTCFRCSQNGHMASACPHRGHGGNGPAPVV
ncbi:unnamed protein product [Closterium sp. NIES-53]